MIGGKYCREGGGVVAGAGAGEEALAVRGEAAHLLYSELEGEYGGGGWSVEVDEIARGALNDDVAQGDAVG